jgi:NAD-dependent deacetylase
MKKKIVILTGAGISAESGIKTFRDSQGLWEEHKVEDVASPRGWLMNPELVLEFYNQRRRQVATVEPNDGHRELLRLNEKYDVSIVTQNIDDLHERAGSNHVLHLHGKITEAKSSGNEDIVKEIGYEDIKIGELCEEGYQMRPNIVWFGESVPKIPDAESISMKADIFVIIGTSLNVYPAAGLMRMTKTATPIYVVDPGDIILDNLLARKDYVQYIKKPATTGVKELVDKLMAEE